MDVKISTGDILEFLLRTGAVKVGESAVKQLLDTDIEDKTSEKPQRPRYDAQPIPTKKMIYPYDILAEMRKMDSEGNAHWSYNGMDGGEEHFLRQAQFMKDFEDTYKNDHSVSEYIAHDNTYRFLNDMQLRCYFTWRTNYRQGKMTPAVDTYLRIHLHELFYGIGSNGYEDGIGKIAQLWNTYHEPYEEIDFDFRTACKEYYMSRPQSMSFMEFIAKYGLNPDTFPLHYRFDTWTGEGTFQMCLQMSDYKIRDSKFYAEDKLLLFEACYVRAMHGLGALFEKKKLKADALLWGRPKKSTYWKPHYKFTRCPWYAPPKGDVIICSNEWYAYRDGQYTLYEVDTWKRNGEIILGYILKRIEMNLRVLTGFKYKLSPNKQALEKALHNVQYRNKVFYDLIRQGAIDEVIDQAVKNHMNEKQNIELQKAVVVDLKKLSRIRKDAEIIQDRLLVEEIPEMSPVIPPKTPEKTPPLPVAQSIEDDEWTAFNKALSSAQMEVIRVLITGSAEKLPEIAAQAGILPEVMLEQINELSLECIGDNIIDTAAQPPCFYEDYLTDIHHMIGGN